MAKKFHDPVDKSAAPDKGNVYMVKHQGQSLYKALITDYKKGACWATVQVQKSSEEPAIQGMYNPGDSFQIKVAMYEFMPVNDGEE
jgi:translation elongation factor EF-Tu-like GTPase